MTQGTVRMLMTLVIDGRETDYRVKPLHFAGSPMRSFEVKKQNEEETTFRVWESSGGTHCNCQDYERNNGHNGVGCKHVRALRAYGMVE